MQETLYSERSFSISPSNTRCTCGNFPPLWMQLFLHHKCILNAACVFSAFIAISVPRSESALTFRKSLWECLQQFPNLTISFSEFAWRNCSSNGFWMDGSGHEDHNPDDPNGWTNFTECFPPELTKVLKGFSDNGETLRLDTNRKNDFVSIVLSISASHLFWDVSLASAESPKEAPEICRKLI